MMSLSKTEAKVINYLYAQGQDLRYAAEIARELNIKKRTIYDTLDSLKRKGIVEEQIRGQMKFYKLNDKWRDVAEAAKISFAETGEAPIPTEIEKGIEYGRRISKDIEKFLPIAERVFTGASIEKLKEALKSIKKELKEHA